MTEQSIKRQTADSCMKPLLTQAKGHIPCVYLNHFCFREAFHYVQQRRFCINPNEGFVQQLMVRVLIGQTHKITTSESLHAGQQGTSYWGIPSTASNEWWPTRIHRLAINLIYMDMSIEKIENRKKCGFFQEH